MDYRKRFGSRTRSLIFDQKFMGEPDRSHHDASLGTAITGTGSIPAPTVRSRGIAPARYKSVRDGAVVMHDVDGVL
jgi:hypothetical protein